MPYPDKVLTDGELVVAALHPHVLTVFWPVVRLLLVVGVASFGMAMVPAGPDQGLLRLAVLCGAVLLASIAVVRPLMCWRTTHYVVTTHRVLHRTGVLTRNGRDVPLSRISDASFSQTLWERVIRSGTLWITSAGEPAVVMYHVPKAEQVHTLITHMVEEEADRRAQDVGGHVADWYGRGWAADQRLGSGCATTAFDTGPVH